MKDVLQIINDHATATGNLSGISPVQVSNRAQLPVATIRRILNGMHAAKKIVVREGINSKLVFAAKKRRAPQPSVTNNLSSNK